MVLVVIEAAVSLYRQEVISIPLVPCLEFGIGAEQIEGNSAFIGGDLYSALGRLNLHPPVAGMSAGMKITIIDKCFGGETHCSASSEQGVLNVSGVLVLAHPDALLEQRVGQRKPPDRSRAFQAKTLDVQIALGFDGAADPAICGERVVPSVVARGFLQLCDQLSSLQGRMERGDKKTVIAAG